jgi:hypothetical protein
MARFDVTSLHITGGSVENQKEINLAGIWVEIRTLVILSRKHEVIHWNGMTEKSCFLIRLCCK